MLFFFLLLSVYIIVFLLHIISRQTTHIFLGEWTWGVLLLQQPLLHVLLLLLLLLLPSGILLSILAIRLLSEWRICLELIAIQFNTQYIQDDFLKILPILFRIHTYTYIFFEFYFLILLLYNIFSFLTIFYFDYFPLHILIFISISRVFLLLSLCGCGFYILIIFL